MKFLGDLCLAGVRADREVRRKVLGCRAPGEGDLNRGCLMLCQVTNDNSGHFVSIYQLLVVSMGGRGRNLPEATQLQGQDWDASPMLAGFPLLPPL